MVIGGGAGCFQVDSFALGHCQRNSRLRAQIWRRKAGDQLFRRVSNRLNGAVPRVNRV
jgi:hypothetical protein